MLLFLKLYLINLPDEIIKLISQYFDNSDNLNDKYLLYKLSYKDYMKNL